MKDAKNNIIDFNYICSNYMLSNGPKGYGVDTAIGAP
jgi:hypothetical protein